MQNAKVHICEKRRTKDPELEERKNDKGRFDGEEASQNGIARGILVHDRSSIVTRSGIRKSTPLNVHLGDGKKEMILAIEYR